MSKNVKVVAVDEVDEPRRSLNFLKSPSDWPYVIGPVKSFNVKHGADIMPACGIVSDPNTPRVRILNIFQGWTNEQFDNAPKFEYDSFEELVDDGWRVD